MRTNKTFTPRPADIEPAWWVVDAAGIPLGRLASRVAGVLRGKHKPSFAPHVDGGDFVVVVNARKVALTGAKAGLKRYFRHSGYPGGLTESTFGELLRRHPERIVEDAVRGMLPKNRLGRRVFKKLRVYADADHPHGPQRPQQLEIDARKVAS